MKMTGIWRTNHSRLSFLYEIDKISLDSERITTPVGSNNLQYQGRFGHKNRVPK